MNSVASPSATSAPAAGDSAVDSSTSDVYGSNNDVYGSNKFPSQDKNVADRRPVEKAARFERQVAPLRELLYRHALHMCHNRADAEDLVQDTMVKAYSNFHSFAPDSNIKAWLYRIQTNTYISDYRRQRRQPLQCSTDGITDRELAAHEQRTSSGLVSAEDAALAMLPDTEVMAAMQSLPEQFRAVVYYADVEGFRYREIAEIMGTPHGTVMSRLARGREHLRRLLVDSRCPGSRGRLPASA
jgi:RNA polymerase sigma-70 factor (ECF subfamily)